MKYLINKKTGTIFLLASIIIIIDQITKNWVINNFSINESLKIIDNVFYITYIVNSGAGFGILKQHNELLVLISIFVIYWIFVYIRKISENEFFLQFLIGSVLGGTIGNLIDRLRFDYVIDFLDLRIWPVFNIADSFITIGIIGLIFYFWKKE